MAASKRLADSLRSICAEREDAYNEVISGLPGGHGPVARQIVREFIDRDLLRPAASIDLADRPALRRFAERLVLMALEREALVTVAYGWDKLAVGLDHELLRKLVLQIWQEETYHEGFFTAIHHAEFRRQLWLAKARGAAGGNVAAEMSRPAAGILKVRQRLAKAALLAAELIGAVTPAVRKALRARGPAAYARLNVGLEITAYLAYVVTARLFDLLRESGSTIVDARRLSWKLMEIAGQELNHARIFAALCAYYETGGADQAAVKWLEGRARLVRLPSSWPAPSRLGPLALRESIVREGGNVREPVFAALDTYQPATTKLISKLALSGVRIVSISSTGQVARRVDSRQWSLVAAVAGWLAEQRAGLDFGVELHALGEPTTSRRNPPNVLFFQDLADLARGSQFDAIARPVVSAGHQLLASYGSFIETYPDLLHDTWDIWQLAGLRLSVCTVSRKGDRRGPLRPPASTALKNEKIVSTKSADVHQGLS